MRELLLPSVSMSESFGAAIDVRKWAKEARTRVKETMTTSDFAFMADLIDRGVKQGYLNDEVQVTYPILGQQVNSKTFEPSKAYEMNADKELLPVAEKGEYLPVNPEFSEYEFTMRKYGKQWDLSWEAYLRDQRDLNILMGYPQSWGLATRYTREKIWTETWAANASFFTAARGNLMDHADFDSSSAELTIDNLAEAIATLRQFPDKSGNVAPYMGRVYLCVPTALEATAKKILNSTEIKGDQNEGSANPMYGAATLVVNHFLQSVDTVQGDKAWYLFCSPSLRPAVRYGYLNGYEEPEIFVKDSDARSLMGGAQDPFAGSFATDDIAFKIRMTFGTGLVNWRGALMSTGAAS